MRDFLLVHRDLQRLGATHRERELRFEDVEGLVGDSDGHRLFRLKERCHALFRQTGDGAGAPAQVGREALFDLAIGALFHEAMKLREGVYQQTVYGPRVRTLREAAAGDADELFAAFESMLAAGAERLEETLAELDALRVQTRRALLALLLDHRDDGRLARFLVESAGLVEDAFERPLDAIADEVLGGADRAWALAGRSYLESGFFRRAAAALAEARRRSDTPELVRLEHYALGMRAYLDGRYADTLESLTRWAEAGPGPEEAARVSLAESALAKLGALGEAEDAEPLSRAAAQLAGRLRELSPHGPEDAPGA